MMKLERRVERLERHMVTAEELLAEVRARAILKPDYHPDDVAFNPCGPQRVAELEEGLADMTYQRDYNAGIWVDMKLERDKLRDQLRAVTAERDALQAKLDAGVRVWGDMFQGEHRFSNRKLCIDTHTALLIDRAPIADHVVDGNEMVPEPRTGPEDRRVNPCTRQAGRLLREDGHRESERKFKD